MIKCPNCHKEVISEVTEQAEDCGIFYTGQCPKCHIFLGSGWIPRTSWERFEYIKQIIEKKYKRKTKL